MRDAFVVNYDVVIVSALNADTLLLLRMLYSFFLLPSYFPLPPKFALAIPP